MSRMDFSHLTERDITHMIRVMRLKRDEFTEKRLLLTEREARHGDGEVARELLLVDAELDLLTLIIAKLWAIIK